MMAFEFRFWLCLVFVVFNVGVSANMALPVEWISKIKCEHKQAHPKCQCDENDLACEEHCFVNGGSLSLTRNSDFSHLNLAQENYIQVPTLLFPKDVITFSSTPCCLKIKPSGICLKSNGFSDPENLFECPPESREFSNQEKYIVQSPPDSLRISTANGIMIDEEMNKRYTRGKKCDEFYAKFYDGNSNVNPSTIKFENLIPFKIEIHGGLPEFRVEIYKNPNIAIGRTPITVLENQSERQIILDYEDFKLTKDYRGRLKIHIFSPECKINSPRSESSTFDKGQYTIFFKIEQ